MSLENPQGNTDGAAAFRAIVYDAGQLRQEFTETIGEFSRRMQTAEIEDMLGRDLLAKLRATENGVRARLSGDFRLVVLGDFKRGKSTLVNALLGVDVATTNVTPETVTINEIGYGPELKVEACLEDGGRVRMRHEELKADALMPLIDDLPQRISHLDIEAPAEMLQGVTLVDTPGTGDVMKQFDRQVHEYLQQADAVLFLVSALSPLSESEETFLRLSIQPQEFPKLFFLVNMLDFARTEEEAEKVMGLIRKKIERLFPEARVFGISALDEVCRQKGIPRPNPERAPALEASFQALRDALRDSILLDRNLIQLDRAGDQMDILLKEFEANLQRLQGALQTDQARVGKMISDLEDKDSELSQSIEQHKKKLRLEIEALSEESQRWMAEFLDRVGREVVPSLSTFKFEDIQKHFQFFLTDSLRAAMDRCVSAHQPAIIEAANTARKAITGDVQHATSVTVNANDVATVSAIGPTWSHLDTAGFVLENLVPFGGVLRGVLRFVVANRDALKIAAKQVTKKMEASRQIGLYQERLQAGLPELKETIEEQITEVYRTIAVKMERQIEAAYRQDREATLAALRQAQEINAAGEQRVKAAQATFGEITAVLEDARQSLGAFERKLWPQETTAPAAVAVPA